MISLRFLLVVSLCIPGAALSGQAAEPRVTFDSVVKTHFPEWTKGSPDGKLVAERVDALVNSTKVRAEEAAAIAAIHHFLRGKNAPKTADESFLLNPKNSEGPEVRPDEQTKDAKFQQLFASYMRHLKAVPRTLFEANAPQRTGIHQGRLGDCFVVSSVGALVSAHPERVKSMIEEKADGSYLVAFPDRQPIKVPKLTDAQIVLGSTAGQQGLWINVMEEAIAIERNSRTGTKVVAMDAISAGGSCMPILELLTGHKVKHVSLRSAAAKDPAGAEQEAKKILMAVHEQKILACASTGAKEKGHYPPGIASKHAYAVIGYEPEKGLVKIWNPWGNQFEPKGEAGVANGYPTKDGVFAMPVGDFVKVFSSIEGQTSMLKK